MENHSWVSFVSTPKGTKRLFHLLALATFRRSVGTERSPTRKGMAAASTQSACDLPFHNLGAVDTHQCWTRSAGIVWGIRLLTVPYSPLTPVCGKVGVLRGHCRTFDGVDNIEQEQRDPNTSALLAHRLPSGGFCGNC